MCIRDRVRSGAVSTRVPSRSKTMVAPFSITPLSHVTLYLARQLMRPGKRRLLQPGKRRRRERAMQPKTPGIVKDQCLIGGTWTGAPALDVINPATGAVVGLSLIHISE